MKKHRNSSLPPHLPSPHHSGSYRWSPFPLWKFIPPAWAHHLAPLGVRFYARYLKCTQGGIKSLSEPSKGEILSRNSLRSPFQWEGLSFSNPIGLAGGVDKNGLLLPEWRTLGFGFVEVGTVTPLPQGSNSGPLPTLDRDWKNQNLWNRMGFPNQGADHLEGVLRHFLNLPNGSNLPERSDPPGLPRDSVPIPPPYPLFVNIGKNRWTPTSPAPEAAKDYLVLARRFAPLAGALVVNVSSPNTQNLRTLQHKEQLQVLCTSVVSESGNCPVLLKLSPDLSEEDLISALRTGCEAGLKGFILTNTTLFRPPGSLFHPSEGGLSGRDLAPLSLQALHRAVKFLGDKRERRHLLISAGGIMSAQDAKERLRIGANLVQIYSALVFQGPKVVRQWLMADD